jgi:nicotinic acid mononucleotide adenylyltransferase
LTKKSSAQAFFDVSLTKSLLSTQTLSRFEARTKRREERGFWVLGGTSLKFLVEWNKWATIRSEGRAIYTLSKNLTVQIYVGTADLYRKHCSYKVKVTA